MFPARRRLAGTLVCTTVESRLLEHNVLGDPSERELFVYLPPSYDDHARFPTLTVLAGFGGTHRSLLNYDPWEPNIVERIDALITSDRCAPIIVVLPDATTRWGGSQYLDSEATAPYQSYIADEITAYVDGTFKTIPEASSRGVVGRSSGGFGALRLGLDRPDRFSVFGSHAGDAAFDASLLPLFATAAATFARFGGLQRFVGAVFEQQAKPAGFFDAMFVLAAGAAYAPAIDSAFPHLDLPFDEKTLELVPEAWKRWCAHDPVVRLEKRKDAMRQARFVYLDAGNRDEHGLQFGARRLFQLLTEQNVSVEYEEFEGAHRGTSYRYEVSIPKLAAALIG